MGLIGAFWRTFRRNYREHGLRGVGATAVETRDWIRRRTIDRLTNRLARRGSRSVYEREWDVLLLLDCARVDMMEAVRDEYEYVTEVSEHVSPGTTSPEWMEHTFTDEYADEIARTLHVTANPHSADRLDGDDFLHLEEVWRDGWNEEHGTILPRTITDRAIALHRELRPDRTIVHYMQPHGPFIPFPDLDVKDVSGPERGGDGGKNVPELVESGYTREELWKFHVENLRCVLDDLEVLLSNIDADRVVISADHGQALGEGGEWGHHWGSTLDCLRTVPWCETSASDTGTYEPEYELDGTASDDEDRSVVEDRLEHLGYASE